MLTHCPICKYNLTGLPDQHHCPECGYDYDRDSHFVDHSGPMKRIIPFVVAALAIWAALLIWQRGFDSIFLTTVAYPVILVLPWILRTRRVTLLTPTELQFIRGRKILGRCSMEKVWSACWSPYDGHVSLHDAEGRELRRLPDSPRWSPNDTKRIAAAINNRLKLRTEPCSAPAVAEKTDNAVDSLAVTSERP